jgi:hypothetical protein
VAGNRLGQARAGDPATRQRDRLELELAKAATSSTAMTEAFSEQLLTIDELRATMPHLHASQANLHAQIDASTPDYRPPDRRVRLAVVNNEVLPTGCWTAAEEHLLIHACHMPLHTWWNRIMDHLLTI